MNKLHLRLILTNKTFIFILFIINLLGTIYGYIWYASQLKITPLHFLPFVPDSPTASLFFTIFLLFFLFNRHIKLIEALAVTSLFKYGMWAVGMNFLTLTVEGGLPWQGYMLIASHLGMAIQGILYIPYYKFQIKHLFLAGIILLHNEIIDYVFGMMPIYSSLAIYQDEIGYFTFWLSIATLILVFYLMKAYNQNFRLTLK